MKYILFAIYTGLAVLNIWKFKAIEKVLVNFSLSWTLSKLIPYLSLLVIGLLMARWFKRRIVFKVLRVKKILFWSVIFVPFVAGFIVNPIYEGDFSQNGTEIKEPKKLSDYRNSDLTVITIPGCPFCYESISKNLKPLKERNPKMRINFVVCTKSNADLTEYKKEGGTAINVKKANNPETLMQLAEGRFPSFVLVENNMPVYKWSNDQFGVRALDKLEKEVGAAKK